MVCLHLTALLENFKIYVKLDIDCFALYVFSVYTHTHQYLTDKVFSMLWKSIREHVL